MRISIITPSYNASAYLGAMIESVKSQQGSFEVEHIILDNCSNDGSKAILQNYSDSSFGIKVRLFIEPDSGQTAAINRGFRMATGDIVCWLNADETYEANALAKVEAFLRHKPHCSILFGDFCFTNILGEKTKLRRAFGFSGMMLLYYGCYIPSCATFVRKEVLEKGEFLDESYRITMDYEYYVRLFRKGYQFCHIAQTLSTFSLREDNVSVSGYKQRRQERQRVLNKYSGLPNISWLRKILFPMLEWCWIVVRIFQRKYYCFSERL